MTQSHGEDFFRLEPTWRPGRPQSPLQAADNPCEVPLNLLIIGNDFVSTYPLPEEGDLVIGRDEMADIQIHLPAISRRHAILRMGNPPTIEDLGSSNGTVVRDQRLTPGQAERLALNEVIEIGPVIALVQGRSAVDRPRRLWTHGYFEARLEEECARCLRTDGRFSLLRIHVIEPEKDRRNGSGETTRQQVDETSTLGPAVLAALRPCDIVAAYAPNEFEALVVDASPEETALVIERIRARVMKANLDARIAVAAYPRDGRSAEELMANACAGVGAENDAPRSRTNDVVKTGTMKNLQRAIGRVAASSISVLVLGETGVGKELFMEQIHALSPRAKRPLLRLNCAALSPELLESELFGHVRGAFTGANADKQGLLEIANGGTVFLDEIGDLPLPLQAKLLRVIEERKIWRVGSLTARDIDVRFITATHRNLEEEAARGAFRSDLFYRINGVCFVIPPLRQRRDEIIPLAQAFIHAAAETHQLRTVPTLDPGAIALLQSYTWPGNVRELKNAIHRAVLLCGGGVITVDSLPAEKMSPAYSVTDRSVEAIAESIEERAERRVSRVRTDTVPEIAMSPEIAPPALDLRRSVDSAQRAAIEEALVRSAGNQRRAAELLGISRRTLINRIEAYGLPRPRKRPR